jgi:hypothetical protein
VIFQPGKNRDGWFNADHLLAQVDHAIDIFEEITGGYAQGLFLFDNAPSHQKHADDALSALQMVKGASFLVPQNLYFHFPLRSKQGMDAQELRDTHALWYPSQWRESKLLFPR